MATRTFEYTPPPVHIPQVSAAATNVGLSLEKAIQKGILAPTTGLFTLPFAAYCICLSQRVIAIRKATGTVMGEHSKAETTHHTRHKDPLYVAIRAHAGYIETVPFGLLLALVAELNGANKKCLAWSLGWLWGLRLLHVEAGLRRHEAKGVGRLIGYYGTQAWFAGMATWCVYLTRDFWGI